MLKSTYFLLVFLAILTTACTSKRKFNHELWNLRTDPGFPPKERNAMVDDLTNNYTLKGLTSQELRRLVGEPDYTDSTRLTYKVVVDYGWDIDPVYTKRSRF